MHDLVVFGNADEAIGLVCALVDESPVELLNVIAAGPLEDLLTKHGPQVVDRILAVASSNERMQAALLMVWDGKSMDPIVFKKVQLFLASTRMW